MELTKTVTAKARVKVLNITKTVSAKARIKGAGVTKTISAKSRILKVESKTVTSKALIVSKHKKPKRLRQGSSVGTESFVKIMRQGNDIVSS